MNLLSWLFTVGLIVGVPVLSLRSVASIASFPGTRAALYLNASATLWLLGLAGWLVIFLGGRPLGEGISGAGPSSTGPGGLALWSVGLTAAGLIIFTASRLLGRRFGWKESASLEWLRPRGPRDALLLACVLAPSAGICEEFLYRGFLPARLGMLGTLPAAVVCSAAFGAAHLHQGWPGGLRAALVGFLLAGPPLLAGSIIPSMIAHTAIDILATLLVWPLLERRGPEPRPAGGSRAA
ncbi:MAG: CPBP family intramembrane glutamic endopeptidase [Acidobacteriota bacterium]